MGLPVSPITIQFIGPTSDDSFVQLDLNKFIGDAGPIEWNSWSAIGTSATVAFTDSARTVTAENRVGDLPVR